jgi:hypothetical protein
VYGLKQYKKIVAKELGVKASKMHISSHEKTVEKN